MCAIFINLALEQFFYFSLSNAIYRSIFVNSMQFLRNDSRCASTWVRDRFDRTAADLAKVPIFLFLFQNSDILFSLTRKGAKI